MSIDNYQIISNVVSDIISESPLNQCGVECTPNIVKEAMYKITHMDSSKLADIAKDDIILRVVIKFMSKLYDTKTGVN